MARDKRGYIPQPTVQVETVEAETAKVETVEETPEAIPVDSEREAMVAVVQDTWELRPHADGTELWINSRDFVTQDGGAVPQGVARSLEDACALEAKRRG